MKHSQDITKRERLERGAARSTRKWRYKALIAKASRKEARDLLTRRDET